MFDKVIVKKLKIPMDPHGYQWTDDPSMATVSPYFKRSMVCPVQTLQTNKRRNRKVNTNFNVPLSKSN